MFSHGAFKFLKLIFNGNCLCACLYVFLGVCLSACHKSTSADTTKNIIVPIAGHDVTVITEIQSRGVHWERKTKQVTTPIPHLEVEDLFSNESSEIVGIKINHFIAHDFTETWLGGQKYFSLKNLNPKKSPIDFSDPWNPTLYAQISAQSGIGLVAEDDVFRQQVRLHHSPITGKAGLRTETLCLGPKSNIQITWSIYESHGDYWDFINDLRQAWGVNHPINGSFVWFQPDDILAMDATFLKNRLHFQGVRTANMFGGWTDPQRPVVKGELPSIGFGTAVLSQPFANLRARIKLAIQKLKAADPLINVLIYFDTQRDSLPNATEIYKDSLFQTSDLKTESTNWMGQYSSTLSVYPTLHNTFGRKLKDVVALVKELGGDGVYWDEMESLDYSGVRFTANTWDGHSCTLDSDGKVVSKIGYTNLLSADAKASYAENAGQVFANSPPTTRYFSQRSDLHMIEGQHLTDYSSYAHLTTPLAYIGSSSNWDQVIAPIENGLLPAGVRLDYTTPFFAKLYPITVLKIYPGVIFGQDKIVFSKSGTYGWKENCREIQSSHFDSSGRLTNKNPPTPLKDMPCVVHSQLEKNNVMMIERSPLPDERPQKIPAFFYQADH